MAKIAKYPTILNHVWWSHPKGKCQPLLPATKTKLILATFNTNKKNKPPLTHINFLCREAILATTYANQKLITPKPKHAYTMRTPLPPTLRITYSLIRMVSTPKIDNKNLEASKSDERSQAATLRYFSTNGEYLPPGTANPVRKSVP
jgi:hypothetical protein